MSIDPPRRPQLPITYIPIGRAPAVWRPAALAVAAARYGAAHGMIPASVAARIEAAPAAVAPTIPLSTHTVVIAMKPPAPPPAPVEAAPPTAAAPVHVAPRGGGMGVHPV